MPRGFFSWDVGVVLYLFLVFWMISRSDTDTIRWQSAEQDEGRNVVLVMTTSAAIISLAVLLVWLRGEPANGGMHGSTLASCS